MANGKADDLDLMVALGAPEDEPAAESQRGEKEGGSYLDAKDPELVMHLMDAVDDALSPEQRAEALCRAIEASRAPAAADMMSEMAPDADY